MTKPFYILLSFTSTFDTVVETQSLRAAVKPGFLFYQVDFGFPLALVSAVFRMGGQKSQLDCGHRGMHFDTVALASGLVATLPSNANKE